MTLGNIQKRGAKGARQTVILSEAERDPLHTAGRGFDLGFLARSPGGFCVRADCGDALSLWAQ
jgi:hypothetical protein